MPIGQPIPMIAVFSAVASASTMILQTAHNVAKATENVPSALETEISRTLNKVDSEIKAADLHTVTTATNAIEANSSIPDLVRYAETNRPQHNFNCNSRLGIVDRSI